MELETIKELIRKYQPWHSGFMVDAITGERYYENETDILLKPADKADDGSVLRSADNRIPRNFHGLIVNQKASYAFTAPPTFDVGNAAANKRITEVLGDEYAKNCMELCINAANTSIGWVHYWKNEGGFEWAVVDSKQVIPVFDRGLKKQLLGVLRVYNDTDDDTGVNYTYYEYWTDTECQAFRRQAADTIDALEYCDMFVEPSSGELISTYKHGLEAVPFIPFWNNNTHRSDLKNIKPLIDVYDKVFSGFINDLDDVQELIFVLSGYGGTDLNGFLNDLKKYKTIKIDADEDGKPGVSTISIEIPIEARNSVLTATRKAIFEQGQGFDPQPENFGNQSGEALKFMYSLLEMKTGIMETEFRLGFARLIRAICKSENLSCGTIIQTWTRTCIKNDTEQAQICRDSVGIISKQTILKNHPFVEDAEAEQKQIDKEAADEQAKQDQYADAFGSAASGGTAGGTDGGEDENA